MRYRDEDRSPRDNARSYGISRPFYDYGKAVAYGGSHPTPGNRRSWPRQHGYAFDERRLCRALAFVSSTGCCLSRCCCFCRCCLCRLSQHTRRWQSVTIGTQLGSPSTTTSTFARRSTGQVEATRHRTVLFVRVLSSASRLALMRASSRLVEASTRRWIDPWSSSPSASSSSLSLVVRLPTTASVWQIMFHRLCGGSRILSSVPDPSSPLEASMERYEGCPQVFLESDLRRASSSRPRYGGCEVRMCALLSPALFASL